MSRTRSATRQEELGKFLDPAYTGPVSAPSPTLGDRTPRFVVRHDRARLPPPASRVARSEKIPDTHIFDRLHRLSMIYLIVALPNPS